MINQQRADRKCICDICNEFFVSQTLLKKHIQKSHQEKQFRCDICDRQCRNSSGLRNHKRCHNTEPSFVGVYKYLCEYCGKKFIRIEPFRTHKRTHFNEFPFECDICRKKFAASDYLTVHKRRHMGDRRYACEICQKTFFSAYKVYVHKRYHTNERPYACDICGRKFHQKSSIKIHMRVHSGARAVSSSAPKKKRSLLKLTTNELNSDELIAQKTHGYNALIAEKTNVGDTKCLQKKISDDSLLKSKHNLQKLKTDELNFNELIVEKTHDYNALIVEKTNGGDTKCSQEKIFDDSLLKSKHNLQKLKTDELNFNELIVEKTHDYNALIVEKTNCGDMKCSQEKSFDESLFKSKHNLVKWKTDEFHFNELVVKKTIGIHKTYSRRISDISLKKHLSNNLAKTNETINKVIVEKDNIDDFCIDLPIKDEHCRREVLNVDSEINDKNDRQGRKKETADLALFDMNVKQDEIYCLNSVSSCNFSEQDSDSVHENNFENSIVDNDKKFNNFRKHSNENYFEDNEKYENYKNNKSNQIAKNKSSTIGKQNILISADKNIKLNIKNQVEKQTRDLTAINSDRVMFCDVCQTTFAKPSLFVAHRKLHTKEKSFKCAICNLECRNLSGLTNHKRIHSQNPTYIGIYRYLCEICGKRFMRIGPFKTHKLTHTGELPFECDICTKKFVASDYLAIHKRRHAGDKRYQCDVCHKKFFNSSKVIIHKRKHTGERPYPCDICNKRFFLRSSVVIHKRVHFKE